MDIKNSTTEGRNEYTYSASGQKLRAVQKWNPNYNTAPVIGSDVNVSALTNSSTTDYVGNIIYENNTLKRILVDGGYYESGNYYFYVNDHLGNNRVVTDAAASVVQSTQYYPFGSSFADASEGSVQPYKYNGKELDARNGLNMSDYSARWKFDWYLPMPDPLAEIYYSISPYAYCNNNPLRFIDPTGMYSTEQWKKDNGITEEDLINVYSASENAGNGGPDDPPKKEESQDPLYYISKVEDVGEIAGASGSSVKDIPGTFRLQGGSNNPKIISYKYYPSGWDGSSRGRQM